MDKPDLDFIMAGFPKCGTTTIAHHLSEHPDVFLTKPKEPGFFCPKVHLKKMSWKDYRLLFETSRPHQVAGEATVNYCSSTPRRLADPQVVHDFYPNIKIIFVAREPLERIRSHWVAHARIGYPRDIPPFGKATTHYSMYLNTTRYWNHVARWKAYYDDDLIFTSTLEHFKSNPQQFMDALTNFLNVSEGRYDFSKRLNESPKDYYDGKAARRMRSYDSVLYLARRLMPDAIRSKARDFMKRQSGLPQWDEDIAKWVTKELKSDSLAFLEYSGFEPEHWASLK